MSFNLLEKGIASFLAYTPALKKVIKRLYLTVNYIFARKAKTEFKGELTMFAKDAEHDSFFGYYDRSPASSDNRNILFHSFKGRTNRRPTATDTVLINVIQRESGELKEIGHSSAFNWQQGARAQWLDDKHVIFNDYENGRFISRIHSIDGTTKKRNDFPIYDICGNVALSLEFDRLTKYAPDYGYFSREKARTSFSDVAVTIIDLTGEKKKEISFPEILSALELQSHHKDYYVNHLSFAPGGGIFYFLFRWFEHNRKKDALMIANTDGKISHAFNQGMVSHMNWVDDANLIGYFYTAEAGNNYYTIDLRTNEIVPLSATLLQSYGDGHPSVINKQMIFDTYPNRKRMKTLTSYYLDAKTIESIGAFFEPLHFFGENRCDLHPRPGVSPESIFIDSTHSGRRKLYELVRTQ
jgi:hypothetical protein